MPEAKVFTHGWISHHLAQQVTIVSERMPGQGFQPRRQLTTGRILVGRDHENLRQGKNHPLTQLIRRRGHRHEPGISHGVSAVTAVGDPGFRHDQLTVDPIGHANLADAGDFCRSRSEGGLLQQPGGLDFCHLHHRGGENRNGRGGASGRGHRCCLACDGALVAAGRLPNPVAAFVDTPSRLADQCILDGEGAA